MADILIKNGWLVDGSGKPVWKGDLSISGDRITGMAPTIDEPAETVVDATGKLVIPGLIDPHVHEEWVCFVDGAYDLFVKQGVTTLVNGNCGHSILPGPTESVIDYYFGNGLLSTEQRDAYKQTFPHWEDFDGYARGVEERGSNLNFVTLHGYGTIREKVMGGAFHRPPTQKEWEEMEAILRDGLDQGMWGVSYGLDYIPGRYADVEELSRVAAIIAGYGGVTAAHLRHYIGIPQAVEEFLEIGRRSGSKLQISHLKAFCPEAFAIARKAIEEEGLPVRIDAIPRSTGHLMSKSRIRQFIAAIVDELFGKGEEGVRQALHDEEGRACIKKGAFILAGSKEEIFVVQSQDPTLENRSVADIARERGIDPDDCILDLIGDDNPCIFWLGGPSREDFPVEGHEQSIVENPYVSAGSDHVMGDAADPFDWYELQRIGCFPVFMQMYRAKGVTPEEVVRRNTSMVAEHFGIAQRGLLREGNYADIAVIDLERYRFPEPEQLHYKTPLMTGSGVEQVLVNGRFALRDGKTLPAYSGRVLKKTHSAQRERSE